MQVHDPHSLNEKHAMSIDTDITIFKYQLYNFEYCEYCCTSVISLLKYYEMFVLLTTDNSLTN